MGDASLTYQTGFGNELESEAEAGVLPRGRNSPQRPAFGLISELVSGTTFTAPRGLNRRTYLSGPLERLLYQDHWKGFTRRFPAEHRPSSQR